MTAKHGGPRPNSGGQCLHCNAPVEPGAVVCERPECLTAPDGTPTDAIRPDPATESADTRDP